MEQFLERIAKALENTKDDALTAYRSSLQASETTEADSLSSVPFYNCYEQKSFIIDAHFSKHSATATVIIWRGYTPHTNGSSLGSFVAQHQEVYSFTSAASGGPAKGGKLLAESVAFSALGSRAVKLTLPLSVSSGTVDFYIRRLA